jgi:[protein-PII] uridylyltransferase
MLTLDQPHARAHAAHSAFDERALADELAKLADEHAGSEQELRRAVAQRLKKVLNAGRANVEKLLLKDRQGRRCAERLCAMHDDIIRILFEFVLKHLYPSENPSESERMAIVATGGYGRGLMAPGSDIDLLFLLPYKQTAWGESVAEAILYCLWDLGLKVGHATRSIDECIKQAKADMTIRTALLEARFLLGDKKLFDEMMARFDKQVVQGTGPDFVAAKLAEREERHRRGGQSRYLVEPNVKDGKGGLRDRTRCSGSPNTSIASASSKSSPTAACSSRRSFGCSGAARTSSGRSAATCISSPAAPRSGYRSTSSARLRSGSATPSTRA